MSKQPDYKLHVKIAHKIIKDQNKQIEALLEKLRFLSQHPCIDRVPPPKYWGA